MIIRLLVKDNVEGNKVDLRKYFKPIKYTLLHRLQIEFPITHHNIALSDVILNVEIKDGEKIRTSDLNQFLGKVISFVDFDDTLVSQNTKFKVVTLFDVTVNPTIQIIEDT